MVNLIMISVICDASTRSWLYISLYVYARVIQTNLWRAYDVIHDDNLTNEMCIEHAISKDRSRCRSPTKNNWVTSNQYPMWSFIRQAQPTKASAGIRFLSKVLPHSLIYTYCMQIHTSVEISKMYFVSFLAIRSIIIMHIGDWQV